MAKKKIIVGNWKMNPPTLEEAERLFSGIVGLTSKVKKTEIVICPPFVYLARLQKLSRKISLGAQDDFYETTGPFTGEISAEMLYNLGIKYVILGHSERRSLGESNADINKKIKASLSVGLRPIVCVGEKERDEKHGYFNVVKEQIKECLVGVNKNLISEIIFAYEPVWALSTTANRHDATSSDSNEMTIFIRKILSDISSPKIAGSVSIIYGGSVTEKDARDFLENGGVSGLLPGRASLNTEKFAEIISIAEHSS